MKDYPWRPPRPDLVVGLEAFYYHLPLGLVLEELPGELFLLEGVLTDPLQAAIHEVLDVPRERPLPNHRGFTRPLSG